MSQQECVINQIESNPKVSIKSIQEELARRYQLRVTTMKAFRAKLKASNQLQGDYKEQYARLRDYVLELQTTKDGFRACGRELLGLDGAFMKGPYPGQLLTAVGLDPNNGIYPLAYVIVEAENKDSWTWFLHCLQDDLDLTAVSNFTFISDRQKGVIPAISTVFPTAEHRFCLRHIHQNMKLKWRGKGFKDCLWRCATATTVPEFTLKMEELKRFNIDAYKWLASIPPQHWSRSHFTGRAKSDVLLNNMCEVLNAKTIEGRDKPIISALEYVRQYMMKRIVNVIKVIGKCNGPLTPSVTKQLDVIKTEAAKYNVMWNGGTKYQVCGPHNDQCVVDVVAMVCSCRRWELTGIPCKHAVAVNWNMGVNGQEVGPIESWVNECYYLDTWKKVYNNNIGPINGKTLWPKSQCPTTLTPPLHHTPIGRPKKKRRKNQVEIQDDLEQGGKFTRKGRTVTCLKCKERGHNSRSCKGQTDATA